MRNAVFAEWMLTRFTDKRRASAIVGDLQEAARQKGSGWFWRSFAGVLVACAWRPVGGYLAAAFGTGLLSVGVLSAAIFFAPMRHGSAMLQQIMGTKFPSATEILLPVALFASFRFGFRDMLTRIAMGYVVLCALTWCFWWQATVPHVLLTVAAIGVVAALFSASARRAIAAVGLLTLIRALLNVITFLPMMVCFRHFRSISISMFLYFGAFARLVDIWLICLCCVWIHRHMLEPRGTTAERTMLT
jgi:hypothetical protein